MRRAVELSRGKGLHRLSTSVIAGNLNAIKLYEKVGFQHEGSGEKIILAKTEDTTT